MKRQWDRHSIRAEVHRRGSTLSRIATAAGLNPAACRVALIRRSPGGEAALAAYLGVSTAELWPDRYQSIGPCRHSNTTADGGASASQNGIAA